MGKKKDTVMSPLKAWNHPFPYQNLDHAFRQDPLDLHQAGYKKKKGLLVNHANTILTVSSLWFNTKSYNLSRYSDQTNANLLNV